VGVGSPLAAPSPWVSPALLARPGPPGQSLGTLLHRIPYLQSLPCTMFGALSPL